PDGVHLENVGPDRVLGWSKVNSAAFILPKSPGSLADRLYSQTVARLYVSNNAPPIMLVIAYGAVQNDLLQLHRPEVCYTAVGFDIQNSHQVTLALTGTSALRVRDLVARTDSRVECITYWTRIGDDLPVDANEQRWMKLRQQIQGYVADGVLVRLSTVGEPSDELFGALASFAKGMMLAISPVYRPALIGREAAAAMA
ncbi:MAG: exosortase C-terminal domain/associated protein EpsI, partial [Sphingomonadales bacterium]